MSNHRADFPIFQKHPDLIYLDSASTSQKPKAVIESVSDFYTNFNANVHRSVYQLGEVATNLYEESRETVKNFIAAQFADEIVFTKGTTESINLLAQSWGRDNLQSGDEVILSVLEHHANYLPWRILSEELNFKIHLVPLLPDFSFDYQTYKNLLNNKTKLVAVSGMSNVTGEVLHLSKIVGPAHQFGAKVLIDAAQLVAHSPINVQQIDCDFLAFSGHKIFGPTGTGILYAKKDLLNNMKPYQSGGSMIKEISKDNLLFHPAPQKFEAGTPNIAGFIGLKAAIEYITNIGYPNIASHENQIFTSALEILQKHPTLKTFISPNSRNIISFSIENVHPHDIASIFDSENIAIRAGHHCAKPLMQSLNLNSTARISLSVYNDLKELEKVERALDKVFKIFT